MKRTVFIQFCVLTSVFAPLRPAKAQVPPANDETRIIAGRLPDRIVKGKAGPVPRLPGGKPDLGNGKGSWNPRVIENIAGVGPGAPKRTAVEKIIEGPFQPWARRR